MTCQIFAQHYYVIDKIVRSKAVMQSWRSLITVCCVKKENNKWPFTVLSMF